MFLQNKFREGKISETTGPLIQQICFTQYTWVCPKLGRLQNRHFNGKDDDLSWTMRSWWFYWYLATFGHVWYAWWPAWMIAWVPLVWETPVSLHRCLLGDTSQLVVYNPYNPIYMYIYDICIWYMCMTVQRDNHIKPIHMYIQLLLYIQTYNLMQSPFVTYIKAHIKTRTEYRGKQSDPPHLNHSKKTCWPSQTDVRSNVLAERLHLARLQFFEAGTCPGNASMDLKPSLKLSPRLFRQMHITIGYLNGSSTLRPLIHPIYHKVHMPVPCSNCLFKACHNVQESKRHPCVKLGGHLDVEENVRVYTRIHKYIVRIHIWLYHIILYTVCICIMMYTYVPLQSLPLHVYIFCCIYAHICSYVLHPNKRCPISSRLPSCFQALVQSQREACRARISGSDGDDDHYMGLSENVGYIPNDS